LLALEVFNRHQGRGTQPLRASRTAQREPQNGQLIAFASINRGVVQKNADSKVTKWTERVRRSTRMSRDVDPVEVSAESERDRDGLSH
jgi:hypothetical protein